MSFAASAAVKSRSMGQVGSGWNGLRASACAVAAGTGASVRSGPAIGSHFAGGSSARAVPIFGEQTAQRLQQFFGRVSLDHESVHRLPHFLGNVGGVAGKHQNRQFRPVAPDSERQFGPIHLGHFVIQNDRVYGIAVEQLQAARAAGSRQHRIAKDAEELSHDGEHFRMIVNTEQTLGILRRCKTSRSLG